MADPNTMLVQGFLFPRDPEAENAIRQKKVDETVWIDVIELPKMIQVSLRGPKLRRELKKSGIFEWPSGELQGHRLSQYLNGLMSLRTKNEFFNDEKQIMDRVIGLMELASKNDRMVWVNF